MYKILVEKLKKNFILQYLHKCFLILNEYIHIYLYPINYSKIKRYLSKNKATINTIKDYVLKSKKEKFRKIIFVIDGDLEETGGVETRIKKTIDFLISRNFVPIIIAKENKFRLITNCFFIKFSFENSLTLKFFIKITKKIKPEYIEFQLKSVSAEILAYIGKKQINELKKISRTGILFHSQQYFLLEKQIKRFDSIISVSTDWLKKFKNLQHKIYKIPNCITIQNENWHYSGQTKILYISRFSKDKIQHVRNLISLCKIYKFSIDIAGAGEVQFIKDAINFAKSKNVDINFIGQINSIQYLRKNLNIFYLLPVSDWLFLKQLLLIFLLLL